MFYLKVTKSHPDEAEVTEIYKDEEVRRHVVYLTQHVCTCREWQITGKPCPHALAVITTMRQPHMDQYVHKYYFVEKFQAAYQGIIPNITDRNQWPEVDKGFKLQPPTMQKRDPGRLKKNRALAASERSGKATRQVKCAGCGQYGHRSGSWKCSLTGTKKRKRTKKSAVKPGMKKKARTDPQPSGANTPRTRAAVAREAATRAIKAAEEAAAKAEAAREAAEAAQREVLEVVPLEIELPSASEPIVAKRNLSLVLEQVIPDAPVLATTSNQPSGQPPRKKFSLMKKKLATKVKKT